MEGRPARAYIDPAALRHNLNQVRRHAPGTRIMAIVKANAYGHGIEAVRALDADAFGVACLEEALALRRAGVAAPIVLLEGFFHAGEMATIFREGLSPVIHAPWQVEALASGNPSSLWVKIDTGMNRLGLSPRELGEIRGRLPQRFGQMTHLACADIPAHPMNARQIRRFFQAVGDLPGPKSLANSAALMALPEARGDWVRPGLMLFGASPFPGRKGAELGLRPAMTLTTRLIAVKRCRQGEAIGYGATPCPEDMPVGIAAIGYGDGYPRHAPPGTPVLVEGRRAHLMGRVSMDMLHIDLRACPKARVGDTVCLWGEGLAIEEVAESAGTLPYELFCQLTARVKRIYGKA
ncbi:MAG: alanine racemase [Gammaproteobacteria bacterium]|nr:MAG: alanine racemase [Gammaproteobacteria bacterium]